MLNASTQESIIIYCSLFAILFGVYNALLVLSIDVTAKVDAEGDDESQGINAGISDDKLQKMLHISTLIQDGAHTFLKTEFASIFVFMIGFACIIATVVEKEAGTYYVTFAFVLGSLTSLAAGYIGMWISVRANVRTTKMCNGSLARGFVTAFRGGTVLGFVLVGLGLLNLVLLIMLYKSWFINQNIGVKGRGYLEMFECIAGYGLGGSAIALFARVGGGIYTKAADVGADLVGKVVEDLDEDSEMNPGTIADNVGDNVGDIAGMGADLFGSFAESTCAALVISGTSTQLISQSGYYYPLLISSSGIVVSFFTTFLATHIIKADSADKVNLSLNLQLFVSSALMSPTLYWCAMTFLPETFVLTKAGITVSNYQAFWCTFLGLWSGYVIGYTTNYYTSTSYSPVQKLA